MSDNDDEVLIAVTYSPENKRGHIESYILGEDPDDRAESFRQSIVRCVLEELEDEGVHEISGGPIDHPSKVATPGLSLSSLADVSARDLDPDAEPGSWEIDAEGTAIGTDKDILQG